MLQAAAVFSDNMVLQRDKKLRVFGRGDEGSRITVALCGKTGDTVCRDGKWVVYLPPLPAAEGAAMEISDGTDTVRFENIAIGEVWLAGGQSNMELELQNADGGKELLRGGVKENKILEKVRFYYTPKAACEGEELLALEAESGWELFNEADAAKWSAVATFFARDLAQRLADEGMDVTVGIIGCNWGGTSASAWTGRKMLEQDSDTRSYVDEYDKTMEDKTFEGYLAELAEYEEWYNAWQPKINEYYATTPNPTWEGAQEYAGPNRWPEPLGPKSPFRPSGLYETMIKRVCPYTLAGFIYYQGESDDHKADTYYKLLKALIEQWRTDWEDDSLPFIFVQLPMFMNEGDEDFKHWCKIREAQMRVHRTTANTGIAVALDKGEFNNIHPLDKEPVGYRLALQAMYHVYGKISADEAYGAIYKSCLCTEGGILLSFDHAKDGFDVKGEKIVGFEIAGVDKKYAPADAEIRGDKIFVRSEEVIEPLYLRYNWTNYGEVTVYSKNGIPLAPFRTSCNDA